MLRKYGEGTWDVLEFHCKAGEEQQTLLLNTVNMSFAGFFLFVCLFVCFNWHVSIQVTVECFYKHSFFV